MVFRVSGGTHDVQTTELDGLMSPFVNEQELHWLFAGRVSELQLRHPTTLFGFEY